MEFFEIFTNLIGHLAWPIAMVVIFVNFKNEISGFLGRIKNAKYKGIELDLQQELEELKSDAGKAGVTIHYSPQSFSEDNVANIETAPEWTFIRSWQEIENLIVDHYSNVSGLKDTKVSFPKALQYLHKNGLIDFEMEMLINKLRQTRNLIVHRPDSSITRGEAIEWLGISKSVKDRLSQKLSPSP